MRKLRYIFILSLFLFSGALLAQEDISIAYKKAAGLNDRQEYLKAAKAFQQVQEMALRAGDRAWYMNSVTAAGECFYKLNIATQMKAELDKATMAFTQYAPEASDSLAWEWLLAINKLEGSYQYCLFDAGLESPLLAEKAYKQCLAIIDTLKKFKFDYDESSIIIHRELLNLYYRMEDYPRAFIEVKDVFRYYNNVIGYTVSPRSDKDRRDNRGFIDAYHSKAMVLARLKRFDEAEEVLSMLPKTCNHDPSVIRAKGKILMLHSDVDGVDRRSEAMGYYEQYVRLQKELLDARMNEMSDAQREQYWLAFHDFLFDCYRLEDQAPELLYDLTLYSKGYLLEYQNKKSKSYTWKDVRKSLDTRSCAIEFVQYNGKDDRKQLGALVVTSHCSRPVFVHIAELDNLRELQFGRYLLKDAVSAQTADSREKDGLYQDPALPAKIWTADLLKAMDGATNIYFAADGILHQLAIEYLLPETTFQCHRLTSTRMLVKGHKPLDTRKMLLFGDIDYAFPISPSEGGNDEHAYTFLRSKHVEIVDLPGTKKEIDSVAALRHSDGDLVLSGGNATDSAFCAMAPHFPVVLLSTHGFFLGQMQDGTDLRLSVSDNSMSESGLAFAGCRYSLADTTYDVLRPDGVFSAKELSELALDSTDLVVLSACQTGLGTVTADGVFGVQRALKQAGVRAMIVSLWPVDDEATPILMRNFFRNLQAGGDNPDVYEAFMTARRQLMSEEYNVFSPGSLSVKKIAKYAAPRYSNAFILIDVL